MYFVVLWSLSEIVCMMYVCKYVCKYVCMERINWKLTPLSVRCVAGVA